MLRSCISVSQVQRKAAERKKNRLVMGPPKYNISEWSIINISEYFTFMLREFVEEPRSENLEYKPKSGRIMKVYFVNIHAGEMEELIRHNCGLWERTNNPFEADVTIMDKPLANFPIMVSLVRGIPLLHFTWLQRLNFQKVFSVELVFLLTDQIRYDQYTGTRYLDTMLRCRNALSGHRFLISLAITPDYYYVRDLIIAGGGHLLSMPPSIEDLRKGQSIYMIAENEYNPKLYKEFPFIYKASVFRFVCAILFCDVSYMKDTSKPPVPRPRPLAKIYSDPFDCVK